MGGIIEGNVDCNLYKIHSLKLNFSLQQSFTTQFTPLLCCDGWKETHYITAHHHYLLLLSLLVLVQRIEVIIFLVKLLLVSVVTWLRLLQLPATTVPLLPPLTTTELQHPLLPPLTTTELQPPLLPPPTTTESLLPQPLHQITMELLPQHLTTMAPLPQLLTTMEPLLLLHQPLITMEPPPLLQATTVLLLLLPVTTEPLLPSPSNQPASLIQPCRREASNQLQPQQLLMTTAPLSLHLSQITELPLLLPLPQLQLPPAME